MEPTTLNSKYAFVRGPQCTNYIMSLSPKITMAAKHKYDMARIESDDGDGFPRQSS